MSALNTMYFSSEKIYRKLYTSVPVSGVPDSRCACRFSPSVCGVVGLGEGVSTKSRICSATQLRHGVACTRPPTVTISTSKCWGSSWSSGERETCGKWSAVRRSACCFMSVAPRLSAAIKMASTLLGPTLRSKFRRQMSWVAGIGGGEQPWEECMGRIRLGTSQACQSTHLQS